MIRATRLAWPALLVFAASAFPSATIAAEKAAPPEEATLTSVLPRENDVFAANEHGLFRAMRSDKKWHALPRPTSMPAGGRFARQPANAKVLFYYAGRLYISRDDGNSWHVTSDREGFSDAILLGNGTLYAIADGQERVNGVARLKRQVLMSKDLGSTWKDIAGGGFGSFIHLMKDPDHPDLVCVRSSGPMRAYVFSARDETYQWQEEREFMWELAHETDETFLSPDYSAQTVFYLLDATLSNYFTYDSGSSTSLPAFAIVPDKRAYRFRLSDPKVINVEVQFRIPGIAVNLLDGASAVGLFGLRLIEPGGKRIPDRYDFLRDEPKQPAPDPGPLKSHPLSTSQSYRRSIDLAKLYKFEKPGLYRVQVYYSCSEGADPAKDEWMGFFSSDALNVQITAE